MPPVRGKRSNLVQSMQTRVWLLPGGVTTTDNPTEQIGWNFFWYCSRCADKYAQAWIDDEDLPWKAIGGRCPNCPNDNRWSIPGSLETIILVGWKVPETVLRYQLDCEMKFTRSPDHPWNKENENEDVNSIF